MGTFTEDGAHETKHYAISRFLGVHMEELIAGDDELFPLVFAQ